MSQNSEENTCPSTRWLTASASCRLQIEKKKKFRVSNFFLQRGNYIYKEFNLQVKGYFLRVTNSMKELQTTFYELQVYGL